MSLPVLKIPINNDVTITQGDTIGKIELSFDESDDIDLTGAVIKMQLNLGGYYVFTAFTGSGITTIGPKSFEIDAIQQVTPFPEGVLTGDLQITDTNGNVSTLFAIELTISKQHTL